MNSQPQVVSNEVNTTRSTERQYAAYIKQGHILCQNGIDTKYYNIYVKIIVIDIQVHTSNQYS